MAKSTKTAKVKLSLNSFSKLHYILQNADAIAISEFVSDDEVTQAQLLAHRMFCQVFDRVFQAAEKTIKHEVVKSEVGIIRLVDFRANLDDLEVLKVALEMISSNDRLMKILSIKTVVEVLSIRDEVQKAFLF